MAQNEHERRQDLEQVEWFSGKTVLVKIGSSGLVDLENKSINTTVFDNVANQVSTVQISGGRAILVSSGAVAAGRLELGLVGFELNTEQKQEVAAVGQPIIMQQWREAFARSSEAFNHRLTPSQRLPTSRDLQGNGWEHSLDTAQLLGTIAVFNLNDPFDPMGVEELAQRQDYDRSRDPSKDNDRLSRILAQNMRADAAVFLTGSAGVVDVGGNTVASIARSDKRNQKVCFGEKSQTGTGGPLSKVWQCYRLAQRGVIATIAEVNHARSILDSPRNIPGPWTLFAPNTHNS